jgi:hypothetical protein
MIHQLKEHAFTVPEIVRLIDPVNHPGYRIPVLSTALFPEFHRLSGYLILWVLPDINRLSKRPGVNYSL